MERTIMIAGEHDEYHFSQGCVDAITELGAKAFISYDPGDFDRCDAVLLPGSWTGINARLWGEENVGCDILDDDLDACQRKILEKAVTQRKPVLGICRGFQMINVFFGGSLYQELHHKEHHKGEAIQEKYHNTFCVPGTLLFDLYGESFCTNSIHYQAVRAVPSCLRIAQVWFSPQVTREEQGDFLQRCRERSITETPSDCIIEAAVHESLPIVGLQWHPEIMLKNPAHHDAAEKILRAFLEM